MANRKRWSGRLWSLGRPTLLVVALATLFSLVWWLMPLLLYRQTGAGPDARLKAITDTRTSLVAGVLGVGTLLTLWLNVRVYRLTAQSFS